MWCSGLYAEQHCPGETQLSGSWGQQGRALLISQQLQCKLWIGCGNLIWLQVRPTGSHQEALHILAEATDPGSGPDHRRVQSFTTHSKSYRSRQEAHADTGQYLTLRRGLETEPPAPNTSPTEGNDTSTLLWLNFSPLNNANVTTERKKGDRILKRKKF